MGGSTSEGITSGLSRKGYKAAGSVDWGEVDVIAEQMRNRYGPVPKQGYNVYDFLTEWGLNMASSPPMGNVIQTAAGTARGPHAKMMEGKGKDEMARYMANMASTDKALAAFTDIEVAKQDALGKQKLADKTRERRIEELQEKLFTKAQPGSFASTVQGSLGEAIGVTEIVDLQKERGLENVPADVITLSDPDGTGNFSFDPKALDDTKVWFDPKKKRWLIIVTVTNAEGKEVIETEYFNTFDEAFNNLGKTTSSQLPEHLKVPKKKKETSLFGIVDQSGTSYEEMQQGQKELEKKITERFSKEGDIYEGDTRGYGDIKRIVEHERKKNEIEKDRSNLDKWWKTQASNYGAGYQGVN